MKDAQVHKFSAGQSAGLPAGHHGEEKVLGAHELAPKEAQTQSAQDNKLGGRDLEPRNAEGQEAFVQPGELGPAQTWELDGSQR